MIGKSLIVIVLLWLVLDGVLLVDGSDFYSDGSAVEMLTSQSFDAKVLKTAETWVVEFYAPWCGHCQQLAPKYIKAAEALKGLVRVGAVNCDDHKDIASKYGIRGFPTIKVFKGPPEKRATSDYQGERSVQAIVDSAKYHMPSFAARVKPDGIDSFFDDEVGLPHILLFTDKPKTTNFFKALSARFYKKVALGEVRKSEVEGKSALKQYKVSKYPTLLGFPAGEKVEEVARIEGEMKPDQVVDFMSQIVGDDASEDSSGKAKPKPMEQTFRQPKAHEDFQWIRSSEGFESLCLSRLDGLSCSVAFLKSAESHPLFKQLNSVTARYKFDNLAFHIIDTATEASKLATVLDIDVERGGWITVRGRKRRYGKIELEDGEELSAEAVDLFLSKVVSGDARYIPIPDSLPEWSTPIEAEGANEEQCGADSVDGGQCKGPEAE
eukprot:CAMPEP_0184688260 /NCGR_PEP_ID=MMETSP0312-20130426/29144_1 /TAXON_ID=31354 /ORGANISM="Compsopogon coeruleus, Strain SAG 36.94" /LENGTH=436 /DNA_ID=CAMNT_0027145193 /DNA_START=134 /DNA_END=1444 /DNA_ORIENTATION=+